MVQGDWVDVGVEEESNINHGEHVAHTLGTDAKGQDFDSIADKQTGPRDVVESVVQEDHGDDGASVASNLRDIVAFGANCPNNEAHHHATGGDKEERATAEFVDIEACGRVSA